MKVETIRKLCIDAGLRDYDLFVDFFSKRFPNESDRIHSYCNEWIKRFQAGNPTLYMDIESTKIYMDLIK